MALLTEQEIEVRIKSLPGWERTGVQIFCRIVKNDFVEAMGFVQSVALLAEKADHHPDIDIRWNRVTLVLSTHSEGGLTQKDFDLAEQINSLL